MNSIGVDVPYLETQTKKTSIKRKMNVTEGDNGLAVLEVVLHCNENEVSSLRTCASSFITNLSLICATMKELGN